MSTLAAFDLKMVCFFQIGPVMVGCIIAPSKAMNTYSIHQGLTKRNANLSVGISISK